MWQITHFRMGKSFLKLNLDLQALSEKKKENLLSAIYVGSIFIILALVYYFHIANNLWDGLVDFFTSLTLAPVPTTGISLPAPVDPAAHMNLYGAVFQFSLALGILEIVILMLRVWLHSPVSRKAETIENIVFWLGASYLTATYLVNMNIPSEWFVFWAGIILIFGLALIARAFVLLARR
jgi:tellurite resistance protein TehA-like permease